MLSVLCVFVCECAEVQMGIGHELRLDPDLGVFVFVCVRIDIIKVLLEMSLSRIR